MSFEDADHRVITRSVQHSPHPALDDFHGSGMIGVEVGEHEQIDASDARPREARLQSRRVLPRVDERDPIGGPQQQRIR
ncbi:hypothetical protein GCM10022200_05230 [Microbacterium awajiense]|uniref:Uncharacterized protein n=1 Tax=Microbacterium awajiense TaxID=415214 RepID=A0ABP7A6M8_9MICO